MYNYNFKTKTMSHIFDNLKYVVLGTTVNFELMNCPIEECQVMDIKFSTNTVRKVAYPIAYLGECHIKNLYDSCDAGKLIIDSIYGKRNVSFSIHGDVLYLSNGI